MGRKYKYRAAHWAIGDGGTRWNNGGASRPINGCNWARYLSTREGWSIGTLGPSPLVARYEQLPINNNYNASVSDSRPRFVSSQGRFVPNSEFATSFGQLIMD